MSSGYSYSFSTALIRTALKRSGGLLSASLFVVAVVGGCSPDPVSREFKQAKMDFGPTRTDGDLAVDEISINQMPSVSSFKWQGAVETATWYRAAEDLSLLARQTRAPEIAKVSLKMREAVLKASAPWSHSVANSPYVSAAIGETRSDTEAAIQAGVDMLTAQEPIIISLLKARDAQTSWPTQQTSLVDLLGHVEKFLVGFVSDVEKSEADPQVRKQIVDELRINFGPRISRIRAQAALAYNEPKVYDFVRRIREILKEEAIELGSDLNKQLDLAERLPRDAERINSAKRALAVLIDFWLAASPETRDLEFKPVSKELYDFFKDQSVEDLECLKRGCGLLTVLKREIFILPQLEEYGVRKLRKKLVEAAQTSIRSELENQATLFLPKLHEEVGTMIIEELRRQRGNITKISQDYGAYLRVAMDRMAVAKLGIKEKATFHGVEPIRLRVKVDFENGGISAAADAVPSNNSRFTTGAGAIGSGLAVAVDHVESALEPYLATQGVNPIRLQQSLSRTLFEQINKVLVVGGFKTEASKPFDALSVSIDRDLSARSRFNLRTMSGSPVSFAVPDGVQLGKTSRADAVMTSTIPTKLTVSVGGQADMIRGLSRLAIQLKDWKPTKFDETLGSIVLADFVPDLPRDAVDQKLFPKDLFYAATVGNAAIILQNATKKSSSIGLISPQKRIRWANEPLMSQVELSGAISGEAPKAVAASAVSPAEQETMAVVFDLVNGERATEAKISDVARFLSALTVFLKAIEDIENTKSSVLLERDGDGVSPLDQFTGGRQDIKLLVMAIANFLSKEARGLDGLVRPSYVRTPGGAAVGSRGEPRLVDQALVIRALLDAADAISASIYRHEAQDIFAATNVSFFKPELAFYADQPGSDKAPNLEGLVAMLVAGEALRPHLSPQRQIQWSKLSKPWVGALRDAAERLP